MNDKDKVLCISRAHPARHVRARDVVRRPMCRRASEFPSSGVARGPWSGAGCTACARAADWSACGVGAPDAIDKVSQAKKEIR
jgi:hypothetical protein